MTALTDFSKLKDGDLIFIRSHSDNAPYIAAITGSKLTHCGIVFHEGGEIRVYEGAGRGQYLTIKEWQVKESGGHSLEPIYARRLIKALTSDQINSLKAEAAKLHETHYDFAFAWTNSYKYDNGETKEYVYCSELQYKAYERALNIQLGTPHPMKDYFGAIPADERDAIIEKLKTNPKAIHCRAGDDFDPDELIISPEEVFQSDVLMDVTD
jgi:hypothetical protein